MAKMTRNEFVRDCKTKQSKVKKAGFFVSMTTEELKSLKKGAKMAGLSITNHMKSLLFYT